jgi:hypothetical protein
MDGVLIESAASASTLPANLESEVRSAVNKVIDHAIGTLSARLPSTQ